MKIVYQGLTKSNQKLVIRYPLATDLNQVWRYINRISKEKTYITFQGEKISKKNEAKWLDNKIDQIRQKKCVNLFVFVDNQFSGSSEVTLKERVSKHIGSLGITLAPETRGQGIGKLLMSLTISEAQKKLPGLKMITLECFANNEIALNLYQSLGFIEHGRLPKGLSYRGSLVDEVLMYKPIE